MDQPVDTLPAVITNPNKLRPVRRFLGLPIFIAIVIGAIQVIVGVLGISTYVNRGPLATTIIPLDALSGTIVNIANVGAVLSGAATIFTFGATLVYSGVSRAWLWRHASRGTGVSVNAWQAMSSQGGVWKLCKAPMGANVIVLLVVGAAGIMSTVFSGILLPTLKTDYVLGSFSGMPGYSGNALSGAFISCVNSSAVYNLCASAFNYGSIGDAFGSSINIGQSVFDINSLSVKPGSPATAGVAGNLSLYMGINIPVNGDRPTYRTVGMQIGATCTQISRTGSSTNGYYYQSPCSSGNVTFGPTTNSYGTYSIANGCYTDTAYYLEYAMASGAYGVTTPFAVSCIIQANEGVVTSTTYESLAQFSDFTNGKSLTGLEIEMFATAFTAAVLQDQPLPGQPGVISLSFYQFLQSNGTMSRLNQAMASGMAAAATAGYLSIVPPTHSTSSPSYSSVHDGQYRYEYAACGWSAHVGKIVWGLVSTLFGFTWLIAALYMSSGGTTYDPNDWLQTMNTSAASGFGQFPGTSTGSGLDAKRVGKAMIWYGEIGKNDIGPTVGFSVNPAKEVNEGRCYN